MKFFLFLLIAILFIKPIETIAGIFPTPHFYTLTVPHKHQLETPPPNPIESISVLLIKYGILLDTTVESIQNQPLYAFIDEWMGVTYRYGGKDKKGIDCSHFAAKLMESIYGWQLPPGSKSQYELCDPLDITELKEGDLLFFNTSGGGISHVAVYLGNKRFVHASTQKGVRIDHLEFPYYKRTFLFAGRVSTDKTGSRKITDNGQGAN
ncbi:MAG: C40 family peptidase [Bacteroidetes bacterium]|nr:C40 family peptidase [Bacteroidota bacterium]